MKIIIYLIYLFTFLSFLFILQFITPRQDDNICATFTTTVPAQYLQKYDNFIQPPKNTRIVLSISNQLTYNKNINIEIKYFYPYTISINSPYHNTTVKLKKNKIKKVILKVSDNPYSTTFYKIVMKIIPKKKVALNNLNIALVDDKILENQYEFNRALKRAHKVIVDLDTCKNTSSKTSASKPPKKKISPPNKEIHHIATRKHFTISPKQANTKHNLYIIFDKSGSLNEFNKLPLNLTKSFLNTLLNNLTNKNIKISIGAFADNPEWLFENILLRNESKDVVKNIIEKIQAYGRTNLYKILRTLSEKKISKNNKNYLIIVTDGFVDYAHFKKLAPFITKYFKKTIIVGIGVEINIEFINYLSQLFKATPYFISDKKDITDFHLILNKTLKKISHSPNPPASHKNEQKSLNHNDVNINEVTENMIDEDPVLDNISPTISYKKLYLITTTNIQKFTLNSSVCNLYTIPDFTCIAYNEFFNCILLKSNNYNDKIIASLSKFNSEKRMGKF
ncbi:MAG: VWA domain-containing protein [Planctomycetota bacterium]